jgi:alpha-N-acetylglucosamine transferase
MREYKAIWSSEEEEPRQEPTRHLNISRICNQNKRLILILLFLGILAYLGLRPSFKDLFTTLSNTRGPLDSTVSIDLESYLNTQTGIDWSKFAYSQYVTDRNYLCNSLMIFESLHRLGSRAERLMMYPEQWSLDPPEASDPTLLWKARDEYNVTLVPIRVQHFTGEATWSDSFTKLLAFNQTQYERVISLDSDANVLQVSDHRWP